MRKAVETARKLGHFAKYHLKRRVFDYPAPETAMGIERLDYDPDGFSATLRSYADRFDVRELAAIHYRGTAYPIHRIRAGDPRARKRVLVLAAVHGNEHAGLLAVPALLDDIAARPQTYEGVAVSILAPVNPVGAAHNSRYNGDGYDINRDFVLQLTREARIVAAEVDDFAPHFIISLHEGPQNEGAFIFANRHVSEDAAHTVLQHMEHGGTLMAPKDYFGRKLRPAGYAPSGRGASALNYLWGRVLKMMTMAGYAEKHGLPEITLETPWRSADRDGRMATHVQVIQGVIAAVR